MGSIECYFLKTIFGGNQTEDNGYRVNLYRFVSGDTDNNMICRGKTFTATGLWLPSNHGQKTILNGDWTDGKYGKQFAVTSSTHSNSFTEKGAKSYLAAIGFNAQQSSKIWKHYKNDSLSQLDKGSEPFLAIGINEETIEKCLECHKRQKGTKEAITLLGQFGISQRVAIKIAEKYKEKTECIIKEHPYRLIDFKEISFAACESLAKEHGASTDTMDRTAAGIIQALRNAEKCGDTGIPLTNIIEKTQKVLGNDSKIEQALLSLFNQKAIVRNKNLIQRKETSDAEWLIARRIHALSCCITDVIPDLDAKIDEWENNNGIKLAPQQREAVEAALTNGFCVITGGPGRGKTTIAKCIIDIRKKYGSKGQNSVCLMAPTGMAAKRLGESTGEPATTSHSRLQIQDSESYTEAEDKISDATVLLDEVSMLDLWTARAVVMNIEDGSQVTFVGDIDQLPSVGAGAVLRDIIASGCIPVVRLTEIFRQKGDSKIITNAEKIKKGDYDLEYDNSSFVLYHAEDFETSARYMIALYRSKIKEYGIENVCLLSPHHHARTASCVDLLNKNAQYFNNPAKPGKDELTYKQNVFRIGDIVLNTHNGDGVANGELGVVSKIVVEGKKRGVSVVFSNTQKTYAGEEMDALELGYAITIHKCQGNEYQCVIINLLCAHGIMAKRNLLYTAVTRAKKECNLVSNKAALTKAILTEETNRRKTRLSEKIQQVFAVKEKENPFTITAAIPA